VPDPITGEEVACYVVARPGSAPTEAVVIEHCRKSLLAPKVPKRVVIVADLPKSDSGKVLRDKLKADWAERMKLRHEGVAPAHCMVGRSRIV
jgi:acyl-coenzyme A synthetase/AMP-(fatty) acid ligase